MESFAEEEAEEMELFAEEEKRMVESFSEEDSTTSTIEFSQCSCLFSKFYKITNKQSYFIYRGKIEEDVSNEIPTGMNDNDYPPLDNEGELLLLSLSKRQSKKKKILLVRDCSIARELTSSFLTFTLKCHLIGKRDADDVLVCSIQEVSNIMFSEYFLKSFNNAQDKSLNKNLLMLALGKTENHYFPKFFKYKTQIEMQLNNMRIFDSEEKYTPNVFNFRWDETKNQIPSILLILNNLNYAFVEDGHRFWDLICHKLQKIHFKITKKNLTLLISILLSPSESSTMSTNRLPIVLKECILKNILTPEILTICGIPTESHLLKIPRLFADLRERETSVGSSILIEPVPGAWTKPMIDYIEKELNKKWKILDYRWNDEGKKFLTRKDVYLYELVLCQKWKKKQDDIDIVIYQNHIPFLEYDWQDLKRYLIGKSGKILILTTNNGRQRTLQFHFSPYCNIQLYSDLKQKSNLQLQQYCCIVWDNANELSLLKFSLLLQRLSILANIKMVMAGVLFSHPSGIGKPFSDVSRHVLGCKIDDMQQVNINVEALRKNIEKHCTFISDEKELLQKIQSLGNKIAILIPSKNRVASWKVKINEKKIACINSISDPSFETIFSLPITTVMTLDSDHTPSTLHKLWDLRMHNIQIIVFGHSTIFLSCFGNSCHERMTTLQFYLNEK